MKLISVFFSALFFLAPQIGLCQNNSIQEVPFKIAGGNTITVRITDQGALPAENEKIRITAAAVLVAPSKERQNIPALIWSFGFKAKTDNEISKITVENVFPSDPGVLLISDAQPKIKDGDWIGQIENGDPNSSANPWLKENGFAVFVFKFSVYFKDGSETALYQLSAFSPANKEFLLQLAAQLSARNADYVKH